MKGITPAENNPLNLTRRTAPRISPRAQRLQLKQLIQHPARGRRKGKPALDGEEDEGRDSGGEWKHVKHSVPSKEFMINILCCCVRSVYTCTCPDIHIAWVWRTNAASEPEERDIQGRPVCDADTNTLCSCVFGVCAVCGPSIGWLTLGLWSLKDWVTWGRLSERPRVALFKSLNPVPFSKLNVQIKVKSKV